MSDFYTCAMCDGKFLSIWPDEQAKLEYEELFGKPFDPNAVPVCDDCFFAALPEAPEPKPKMIAIEMQKPCPTCQALYGMSRPGNDPPPLSAGDFALCIHCDAWAVLETSGEFRRPTDVEKIPDSLRFWRAGLARHGKGADDE